MEGQTLLACGSKVIVGFRNLMDNEGGIRLKLMA